MQWVFISRLFKESGYCFAVDKGVGEFRGAEKLARNFAWSVLARLAYAYSRGFDGVSSLLSL